MSDVVLTYGGQQAGAALGFAIGGPIGAAIGAGVGAIVGHMAGSYIDNTFIWPPDPLEPPRINGVGIQSAQEGSPINLCYGPENRIAGTVIWMSEVREREVEVDMGGCGGGNKQVVGYTYSADVAVALCEGEINAIKKIWAEGKIVYADQDDVSITSRILNCESQEFYYYRDSATAYLTPSLRRTIMRITSPSGGPDLSVFRSGLDVESSNWYKSDNNGTFRCAESGDDPEVSGGTFVMLVNDDAVTEASGNGVTLNQPQDDIDPSMVDDIIIYTGSSTQTADSIIEAVEGSGNVPGFRGMAYVVFDNLKLADWGNRIPQFNFLVEKDATANVADTIGEIVERSYLTASDYDVTGVDSISLRGYAISGPTSIKTALEALMMAYDIIAQEKDGILYFMSRENTVSETVATDDLAAHEDGSDTARPLTIEDVMDISLPTEVNVQFLEPGIDYTQGSQRERKITDLADNVLNMNIPVVLTASQARAIAKRVLWTAWMNRQTVRLALPPSYFHILENDRLSVTTNPETYSILVRRIDRGHNHLIIIEGVIETLNILDQSADADESDVFATQIYVPPHLWWTIIDIAPFTSEDATISGFYTGICCSDPRETYPGGSMYRRSGDPATFKRMLDVPKEMYFGETLETLSDGITGTWDIENTIKVRMTHGVPESTTEEDVLNGANVIVVGNEVLAFRDVSQTNDRDYELSHLLRGLRNTEAEAAVHEARERVVFLGKGSVYFQPARITDQTDRQFKAAANGADLSDIESKHIITGMNTLRCFAPCHIKAKFVSPTEPDLKIYWIRRTRDFYRHFYQTPDSTPMIEPLEKYRVQILDAPGGSVIRNIYLREPDGTTYSAPEGEYELYVTYTEVQQIADFGSVQAGYDVKIQQLSARIGWGKPKEEYVP